LKHFAAKCSHGPRDVDRNITDDVPADFDVKGILHAKVTFAPFAKRQRIRRNPKHPEIDEEVQLATNLTQAFLPSIRLVLVSEC